MEKSATEFLNMTDNIHLHAGIKGNEQADFLAGTVAMTEGKSMADILTALKDSARLENLHMSKVQSLPRKREVQRLAKLKQKTITQK